ncbi:MAG: response regulator transcription factor [Thermoguttaceae bacterium]|nr:response regulator transcription factor [Thermoguttaceae bacterium]MDW8077828.1 response regulator transcription factor [Thermoguttaceae bacterium]
MAIKVVIVDDQLLIRTGLAEMLAGSEVDVVGQAGTAKQALQVCEKHKPHVVLLDVRLPDADGLDLLDTIRQKWPEIKVVIVSNYDNPTYVARAAALGASDFVLKSASRDELLAAIRAAAAGQIGATEGIFRQVMGLLSSPAPEEDQEHGLTQREFQVLRHLALGLSNREIARSLGISIETVKEHVQNLLRKLKVSERTQAAVWAMRKGVV